MFNGYFEWALADQDLTQAPAWYAGLWNTLDRAGLAAVALVLGVASGGLFLVKRWRRSP
jgi:hypothetical protein